MSDCCLTSTRQFLAISWREHVNCLFDDDEVGCVLSEHVQVDVYNVSSLKQSVDKHVAQLEHICLIPSQPVFSLSP